MRKFFLAIIITTLAAIGLCVAPVEAQHPSPFNGQIAYTDQTGNLVILRGETSERLPLTRDGSVETPYFSPSFSADGRKIIFCRVGEKDGAGSDVYLVDLASLQAVKIISNAVCPIHWSSDGAEIVYGLFLSPSSCSTLTDMKYGIYQYDISTGKTIEMITPLVVNGSPLASAAPSPDGRSFFVTGGVCEGKKVDTYLWSHETGKLSLLIGDKIVDADWSPNGSILLGVYHDQTYTENSLDQFSPGGTQQDILFSQPGYAVLTPRWSPDAKQIGFILGTSRADGSPDQPDFLELIDAKGGEAQQVYTDQAILRILRWSPDGQQIALLRTSIDPQKGTAINKPELVIFSLATRSVFQLDALPLSATIDWSVLPALPDHSYSASGKVLDMDGKPLQDVTVYVDGLPVTATDISGQYRLSGLKQDQISLRVEKTGYAFVPESVSVKLPVSADVNFKGNLQTIPAVTASVIPVNILSTIQPVGETPQQPHNPDVVEGLFLLAILALLLGALSLYYRRTSEEVTPSAEEQPSPQAESEPITQRRQAPDVLVIEKSLPLEPEQETSAVPEPDLEDLILNGSAPTADDPLADVFQQGTTAVKAGRYQEGIELLSLYVRQAQSNSDAWLWLGVSAMQMGDLILARNCFKQAQWLGHPQAVKALEELAKRSPHNHTSNL